MANQKTDDRSQEKGNLGGSPSQQGSTGNQPGQQQQPDRGSSSDMGEGSRSNVGGSQSGTSGGNLGNRGGEQESGLSESEQDENRGKERKEQSDVKSDR
jgi:hypothetical protein